MIEVDSDRKYNVRYYLGGDWKFLALVTGKCTCVVNVCLCPMVRQSA